MLMDAVNAGLKIEEVEIGVKYNLDGSTKSPIRHGLGVLVHIINDMEFNRPLIYFTLPGAIIITIGLYLCYIFLENYIAGGSSTPLPTILAVMLTLAGGFLTLTGIILDAIRRMFLHISPQQTKAGKARG